MMVLFRRFPPLSGARGVEQEPECSDIVTAFYTSAMAPMGSLTYDVQS